MSTDKDFSLNLSGLGSLLASASGFLAVGGYLSLRAYLNRMEISGPAFLGAERYLLEAYLFADGLFFVLPWMVAIVLALWVFQKIAPSLSRRSSLWAGLLWKQTYPVAAILTVGILYWLLHRSFVGGGLLPGAPPSLLPALQPRRPELFQISLGVALIWWFTVVTARRASSEYAGLFGHVVPEGMARALTAAISLALALALPVLYGRESHPDRVPLVKIMFQDKGTPSLCALAVLHWSDGILVWHAKDRHPRFVSIRLERVAHVVWGGNRSLTDALHVGYGVMASVPDCGAELE